MRPIAKEVWDSFLKDIGIGLSVADAATHNGIARRSVYNKRNDDPAFAEEMDKASVTPKSQSIRVIRAASVKNWTAAAWWLERKFPSEFGLRQKLEFTIDSVIVAITGVLNRHIPEKCTACQAPLKIKDGIIKELEAMSTTSEETEKQDEPTLNEERNHQVDN
jgi:hypothetical protein